jgi:hypothetical protein
MDIRLQPSLYPRESEFWPWLYCRGEQPLTAVEPLEGQGEKTGTPHAIRAFIRKQKAAGADLIKIFASKSIRQGGGMSLSQEQLSAACDEAHLALHSSSASLCL